MTWLGLTLLLTTSAAEPHTQAKELARLGQQAFKEGRYREAAGQFEAALALRPRPALHFNLARCWEALGESAKAARAYREYLRLAPDAADRAVVTASLASLDGQLAKQGLTPVVVRVAPVGATVSLDGAKSVDAPLYAEVRAGEHVVVAEAASMAQQERRFVADGRLVELVLVLQAKPTPVTDAPRAAPPVVEPARPALVPAPPPPPPLVSAPVTLPARRRIVTWVSAGVSGAGALTAVLLGLAANQASTDLRSTLHTRAQGDALVASVRGLSMATNVAWIGAGAALAAAVVLFFVEDWR